MKAISNDLLLEYKQHAEKNTKQVIHNMQPAALGTYAICKYSDSKTIYLENVMLWEVSVVYDEYCLNPIGLRGRINPSLEIPQFYLLPDCSVASDEQIYPSLESYLNHNDLILDDSYGSSQ